VLRDDSATEQENARLTRWPSAFGRWLVRLVLRLSRLVSAHAVLAITAGVGAVLLAGFAGASGEVYEAVTDGDGVGGLDRPVLDTAIGLRSARLDRALTGFTHLGGPTGMTIIASMITLLMVWRWRSRTPLILMIITVAGSLLITVVGKAVVGRSRPPLADAVPPYESSPSFPSGHALNSTVIAGMVAYLVLRGLSSLLARALVIAAALGWAIAIGLSRVFLGHHWLTDVMFGWLVGLAWLSVVITAHRLFLTVRRDRENRAEPTG
jgi:membrane-associated phospholipid phosphatase